MLLYAGGQCATLAKAARNVRAICRGSAYIGSYVDDKWLILPIAHLEESLAAFIQPFRDEINQHPELSKFRIHAPAWQELPDNERPAALLGPVGSLISWEKLGTILLGSPVGHISFMSNVCLSHAIPASDFLPVVSKHYAKDELSSSAVLEQIRKLDDPQQEWSLVASCVNLRHTHRFRTTPPQATWRLAEEHDASIWRSMLHIIPPLAAHHDLHVTSGTMPSLLEDTTAVQVRSPLCSGGLGVVDARTTSGPSYVASVLDSLPGLTARLREQGLGDWASNFPQCIQGFNEDLQLTTELIRYTGSSTALKALDTLQPLTHQHAMEDDVPPKGSSHRQSILTKAIFVKRLSLATTAADQLSKSRLLSSSGTGAGAFLSAPPGSGRLTPVQFRGGLSARLGLPISRLHSAVACSTCCAQNGPPPTADTLGIHSSCCLGLSSGHHYRHNEVRGLVCSWCARAGLAARTEGHIAGYRGDIVAEGWGEMGEQTLVIDVTVNNALAPSSLGLMRAENMELQKRGTELARFCEARSDVYCYVPFAVEVHGRLGSYASGLVRQLAVSISQRVDSAISSYSVAPSLYLGLSHAIVVGEDHLMADAAHRLHGSPAPSPANSSQPGHLDELFFPASRPQSGRRCEHLLEVL